MRFPASTTGRYIPGVGRTITQANICAVQTRRAKDGEKPLTPEEIAAEFVAHSRDGCPTYQRRHVARAERLMHGGS